MPPSGWTLLTLRGRSKSKEQCPKLFYRFKASPSDGLELLLTDLISLWRCCQTNPNIITTAGDEHVSIDPSESEEQMNVLLEKIASSLREGKNELAKQTAESSKERVVLLKTGINLPKPLRPLEWTFTLLPQYASELAEQILRPTLHELSELQKKLESLLNIVKEKDHVVERLLDRVAEKGIDMSLIFPTLTGTARRGGGVKVEDAKKNLPGLKPFDRKTWEKGTLTNEEVGIDYMGLTELVKGCEKCFVHSKEEHNGWLEHLPGPESFETAGPKSFIGKSQSQSQLQPRAGDDTESENEFETQANPPGGKRKSTESDEDTSDNVQPVAKKARIGKINALGQRNKFSKPQPSRNQDSSSAPISPVHTSSPPPQRRKSSPASATDTESESHVGASPPQKKFQLRELQKKQSTSTTAKSPEPGTSPSPLTTAASNASTPSRRLGRIGKTRDRTATASPIPDETQDKQGLGPRTATARKLGRLGARRKDGGTQSSVAQDAQREERLDAKEDTNGVSNGGDESDATASPSPPQSPSPSKLTHQRKDNARRAESKNANRKDSSPPPDPDRVPAPEPETEEQKAARRREELKRTIQASGAKKKRRF